MIGPIVNSLTVLGGGILGLLLKKGIPVRINDSVITALAIITLYLGITGSLDGTESLIIVLSMVLGTIIGTVIDLDSRIENLGKMLESKFQSKEGNGDFAKGFVNTSLLVAIGSMAIMGSLNSGLSGNHEVLFAKSIMDFFSSFIFAATFGVGTLFAAGSVLLVEGSITLLAGVVAPFLTDVTVAQMNCVGSLLLLGLGLNLLKVTNIKILNMLPAILVAVIFCQFI